MEKCLFPGCTRWAQNNKYCVPHGQYATFTATKEKKKEPPIKVEEPIKPIAKRSEKMKAEIKKLIPAYQEFLAKPENQNCAIKMKGCKGKATVIHHAAGRLGDKLHDQSDWVPSCTVCNVTVEVDDMLARAKGFKKSKFTPKENIEA